MKRLSLFISGLMFFAVCFAQQRDTTNYFGDNRDKEGFMKKEYYKIGNIGVDMVIEVVIITNVKSNTNAKFIKITNENNSRGDNYTAIIEQKYIDDIIKCITTLQLDYFDTEPNVYTELSYMIPNGFEVGAYRNANKGLWYPYIVVKKYLTYSYSIPLSQKQFDKLLELIEDAKRQINSLN